MDEIVNYSRHRLHLHSSYASSLHDLSAAYAHSIKYSARLLTLDGTAATESRLTE